VYEGDTHDTHITAHIIDETDGRSGPSNSTLFLLTASHTINDSYMSLFPPLLPAFIMPALGLSISEVGWLATVFAVTSSLAQLAFGVLTDRIGGRFLIVLGPLIASVFMSSIGLIHSYTLLAFAIAMAGLGVAAFHPPSSSTAGSVARHKRGRMMSVFVLGGNIGFAIMPPVAVWLVSRFGLSSTPLLAIPGILVSVLLFFKAPAVKAVRHTASRSFSEMVRANPGSFASLLGTVAFRSFAFFSFTTFLPKLLHDQGFSPIAAGAFLSILTFSGAIGGLMGGTLSDRLGRKRIIAGSLALSVPFLLMFLLSSGVLKGVFLAMAGASLLAPFSVTVVAAQEIFPDSKAIASSLALGFGLGLGGLGVGATGHLASMIGLSSAMIIISFLPLVAAVFALGLPGGIRALRTAADDAIGDQERLKERFRVIER